MKRVKRIFACLLALTMMFGLSATAFADESGETPTPTDQETVTITKQYKLTNAGTTSQKRHSHLYRLTREQLGIVRQKKHQILEELQVLDLKKVQQHLMEQEQEQVKLQ